MVIERELIKESDVVAVDVSHNSGTIMIETSGDRKYSRNEVNEILCKHDYAVCKKPKGKQKKKINWKRVGGAVVITIALYALLNALGLLRLSPSSAQPTGLIGVLIIGLIASVSSCTAVVGGLVAAVSSAVAKDQQGMTTARKMRPHILFNLGRVVGFFILGSVIGLLGSALQLNAGLNGAFMVAVALLMIVIGVNLMEVFPTAIIGMPKWLSHKVHDLAESNDPKAPMMLGAATFFLPCGFTQSMQLLALSLQDPLMSGAVMAAFAIGTVPVLLGIGSMTSLATGKSLKRAVQAAGVVVLVLGISNVSNGLTLLGFNPDSLFSIGAVEAGQSSEVVGQRQSINMQVTSRGSYEPSVLTVQKDIPVDWNITGADFMGCADTLILPPFGVSTRLRTGPNLVQFTPTKSGTFTFSCSMGMIRGTMRVI